MKCDLTSVFVGCCKNFGNLCIVVGMDENATDILVKSLQQVLADDSFKINLPVTIQARRSAEMLLEWCLQNVNDEKLNTFSKGIYNLWLTNLTGPYPGGFEGVRTNPTF